MTTGGSSSLVLRTDIAGAPVRIGQSVRVESTVDEDTSADSRFFGRDGVVRGFVYDDPSSQFPTDPLVMVLVDGLGEDLFFPAELSLSGGRPAPEPTGVTAAAP